MVVVGPVVVTNVFLGWACDVVGAIVVLVVEVVVRAEVVVVARGVNGSVVVVGSAAAVHDAANTASRTTSVRTAFTGSSVETSTGAVRGERRPQPRPLTAGSQPAAAVGSAQSTMGR